MQLKKFMLPDLGEGLTEATIHKWHVLPNDRVEKSQVLVTVETAKALVDIPAPAAGIIVNTYGKENDVIAVGGTLVEYASHIETEEDISDNHVGAVVGTLEQKSWSWGNPQAPKKKTIDIYKKNIATDKYEEKLKGMRRIMAQTMHNVNREVVLTTVMNDAVLHTKSFDISVTLIMAIIYAYQQEQNLNAWFDFSTLSRIVHKEINLGIACETADGLFVPVIADIQKKNTEELRFELDHIKQQAQVGNFKSSLVTPTFTLSNVGSIGGKYATPIVMPPQVAILAAGQIYESYRVVEQKLHSVWLLPLSLSFDHRVVTGAEAARFLQAILKYFHIACG